MDLWSACRRHTQREGDIRCQEACCMDCGETGYFVVGCPKKLLGVPPVRIAGLLEEAKE